MALRAATLCTLSLLASTWAQTTSRLAGTWSSGSGAVMTGPAIGNPPKDQFNYPKIAGWSISFTADGFFEEAQYSWNSNATDPYCVGAVLTWQHGQYSINSNGSITLDPTVFSGDGRVSVAYACQATSSILTYLDQPILYQGFSVGAWRGKTMLQLQAFDGRKLPRLYQVSTDPSQYMFPRQLINDDEPGALVDDRNFTVHLRRPQVPYALDDTFTSE